MHAKTSKATLAEFLAHNSSMESRHVASVLSILALLITASTIASQGVTGVADADLKLKTYIIRMRLPHNITFASPQSLENWYRSLLPPTAANSTQPRFVYSYSDAITGFAARLTEEELTSVKSKEGFLASYEDWNLPLLTTHTPQLLGLQTGHGLWNNSNMGKGVVIGVLDTGYTSGHSSFSDDGMEPPPPKWKGGCAQGFSGCNKKVIGAQDFTSGIGGSGGGSAPETSPVDYVGHGTHTSSTAAGNFVTNADVLGAAIGTASGVAPRAHLSIYKVCEAGGCRASDILAGMDAAIKDGVDVLSLSLGGGPRDFYNDVIAIGAFSAIERGIFVSCAGGNAGPEATTLSNEAPWILTVAASTIDRNIRATVKLGNGVEFDGETAFQPSSFSSAMIPLVIPGALGQFSNCQTSLDMTKVKGKMAVCKRGPGSRIVLGQMVKDNGGQAMLLVNGKTDGYTTFAEAHWLPASHLNHLNGSIIFEYINTTTKPEASITFKGTILGVSPSPAISFFSSRGPNSISSGVLKPDITGPGVNILAAWPTPVGPPPENSPPPPTFNMISGTSMSTPHLSGIAALIKAAHSDWSPAAIKSAIMTTSDIIDYTGKPMLDEQYNPATFFDMGAGHVNPTKAADPGLVYDIGVEEYIGYLCGLGYTDDTIEIVTHHKIACAKVNKIKDVELNYPAIAVVSTGAAANKIVVNRTAKYTSDQGKSTFKLKVEGLEGVTVKVSPETLEFAAENETKTYTVRLSWQRGSRIDVQGNLFWVSEKYSVRIPMVVRAS